MLLLKIFLKNPVIFQGERLHCLIAAELFVTAGFIPLLLSLIRGEAEGTKKDPDDVIPDGKASWLRGH